MMYRINHTIVLDDPYDDPAGLEIPDRSPEPTSELLQVYLSIYRVIQCLHEVNHISIVFKYT